MSVLLEHVLPYVAVTVCVTGLGCRTISWLRTPAPFPLTLDVAPPGVGGRALAMAGEVVLFRALARADRWLWLLAWLLHLSLALVVVGHVAGIGLAARQFVVLGASPARRASGSPEC